MSDQLEQLGNLKKYIEYLEDYYKNPSSAPQDISAETNAAVEQMMASVAKINAKFDYTEIILDKLFAAMDEYHDFIRIGCSDDFMEFYDLEIDKSQKQITGKFYNREQSKISIFDYKCILIHDTGDATGIDYKLNVVVEPHADNDNPYFKPSAKFYRCSLFTDFVEFVNMICEEYR